MGGALAKPILAALCGAIVDGFRGRSTHPASADRRRNRSALHDVEHEAQIVLLGSAGGRCAADVVEDLAVLEAVICESLYLAVLVEIDRDDPPIDLLLGQKRGLLGALRDIVEHLAADGGDR